MLAASYQSPSKGMILKGNSRSCSKLPSFALGGVAWYENAALFWVMKEFIDFVLALGSWAPQYIPKDRSLFWIVWFRYIAKNYIVWVVSASEFLGGECRTPNPAVSKNDDLSSILMHPKFTLYEYRPALGERISKTGRSSNLPLSKLQSILTCKCSSILVALSL